VCFFFFFVLFFLLNHLFFLVSFLSVLLGVISVLPFLFYVVKSTCPLPAARYGLLYNGSGLPDGSTSRFSSCFLLACLGFLLDALLLLEVVFIFCGAGYSEPFTLVLLQVYRGQR